MDQTIQGGINLVPNPSFEGNAGGGGYHYSPLTIAQSYQTDWVYTGSKSFSGSVTTAASGSTKFYLESGGSAPRTLVTPGQTYSMSMATYTTVSNIQAQVGVVFFQSNGTYITEQWGAYIPIPVGVPIRIPLENVTMPALTNYVHIRLQFSKLNGANWVVGDRVYVDAVQLNPGQTVDHYIDGNQGTHYSWTGTPNASTSVRADFKLQGPTGSGGVIDIGARVFRSDVQGNIGADITRYVLAGSWDWDIDRDGPKTLVKLTIDGIDVLGPMDWVAVFLDVVYEDGTLDSGQLGVFRMELPDRRFSGQSVEIEVSGYDPIILLEDRTLETNVTLDAGVNVVSTIRSYLNQIGVRHVIPDRTNVVPSAGASWKVHTKWSTFLNELAAMAGLYALHTDDRGRVTTKPVISALVNEQARHTYTVGRTSKLVGDILFKPNGSSIFNRVVVARDDPAQGPILTAVRSFTDRASSYSTVNMGVKTRAYSMQNADSQSVLDAYADARIQELSLFMYGELQVIPTPFHTPYEVIQLDFEGNTENPALAIHAGKYYVKAASLDLMAANGTMGLSVRRTERFDNV